MDEMVKSRRLKVGTIREHLLTAAIWLPMNDFPYKNYLTPDVVSYFEENWLAQLTNGNLQWCGPLMIHVSSSCSVYMRFT